MIRAVCIGTEREIKGTEKRSQKYNYKYVRIYYVTRCIANLLEMHRLF